VDKAIAASYLLSIDKYLAKFGLTDFLECLSFDTTNLNTPNVYLSSCNIEEVITKAYQLVQCSELGLRFGKALSIANHGFLGYAAMSSPTIETSITTALKFLKIRMRILDANLVTVKEKAYVQLHVHHESPMVVRFLIEMAFAHLVEMREFLLETDSVLPKIEVTYEKPSYHDSYASFLKTSIHYSQEYNRIWVLSSDLAKPISFADEASFQMAVNQLQVALETLEINDDLPNQIKRILTSTELYTLNMERIAKELFMSSRTLRRRLEQYGVTYKELVDEVKKQKALEHLNQTDISITEISFLLGFQDVSSFSKAFKRWTDMTPSEYRSKA
jgi:AraC-like DNA-binding protein